jgi:hypothetical protein
LTPFNGPLFRTKWPAGWHVGSWVSGPNCPIGGPLWGSGQPGTIETWACTISTALWHLIAMEFIDHTVASAQDPNRSDPSWPSLTAYSQPVLVMPSYARSTVKVNR